MVPREEQVDQIAESGDEGGNVREGGRIQDGIHTSGFLPGADDPHLLQDRLGAIGSVELHRECDKLEDHQDCVAGDAEVDQVRHVEEESAHDHEGEDLRGELRGRNDLHPQVKRAVVELVLQRVAAFVRGDADRGDRSAVVDIGGEAEALGGGIVMVAEHVVDLLDSDIVDPRIGKDAPGGISPGHPRGGGDLLVGLERRGDTELCPEAQCQRRTD